LNESYIILFALIHIQQRVADSHLLFFNIIFLAQLFELFRFLIQESLGKIDPSVFTPFPCPFAFDHFTVVQP
jgi:hypothetical protein